MQLHINKDTQLCISLAARPGNFGTRFHNFLFRELGLNFIYKAFTTRDIGSAIRGVRALGVPLSSEPKRTLRSLRANLSALGTEVVPR
jgi:hypothetical protein